MERVSTTVERSVYAIGQGGEDQLGESGERLLRKAWLLGV